MEKQTLNSDDDDDDDDDEDSISGTSTRPKTELYVIQFHPTP